MGCGASRDKLVNPLRDNFVVERQKSVQEDYQIIRQIGKGSIGIIYLAENRIPKNWNIQRSGHTPKRQYAIKEIDGHHMKDQRAFDSLKTEVRLLKKLDHPFIIKFFASYSYVANDKEKLSVVMELCQGGTLDKYAPYDEATAKILVANILEAVLYLHSNNVIHRDLKNENIMYASQDRNPNNIRVIDFGLANTFSWQNLHERVGTIYTMSPEALYGDYNEKADMWSIGVCTYHLLSGKRPFWGDTKDDIARQVRNARFSFDGPCWEKISRHAKSFIRCLLQIDPVLRCNPAEALKSPWLRKDTQCRICQLSKEDQGVLRIVKESTAPINEMHRLALYAIAHKARAEDISELRQLYLCINKSPQGEITLADMKKALEGQLGTAEIEAWFRRADVEKNGVINFTEFVASSLDGQSKLSSEDIVEAFRIFDRDDSGFITASNLRDALQTKEGEYVDNLIKEADEVGDGQISFREFRNLLMRHKLTAAADDA